MGADWDSFKQGRLKNYAKPLGGRITDTEVKFKDFKYLPNVANQKANPKCLNCGKYKWGHKTGDQGGGGKGCECDHPQFATDHSTRETFIAFMTEVMAECLRVIRPGGHALVWSLPRTSHWTGMALEDAGWQVRNCLTHLFGSGFPKSFNLGNGRGTDLKPACEFWWLVRKPLSEKNIAQNVLRWNGCGALNIDQCRVFAHGDVLGRNNKPGENGWKNSSGGPSRAMSDSVAATGRFPSNLLLSHDPRCIARGTKRVKANRIGAPKQHERTEHPTYGKYEYTGGSTSYSDEHGIEEVQAFECVEHCPVRILGEQSGERHSHRSPDGNVISHHNGGQGNAYGLQYDCHSMNYTDTGTAARYFQQFHDPLETLDAPFHYFSKASKRDRSSNGVVQNTHPTTKNTELMRWLVRLCTPPGGVVLDPFAGSGSTLVACIREGFHFIGIEQEQEYVNIARARIAHAMQEANREKNEGQEEYICVEECPIAQLDAQSGIRKSGGRTKHVGDVTKNTHIYHAHMSASEYEMDRSEGGAARYFQQFPSEPVSLWHVGGDD